MSQITKIISIALVLLFLDVVVSFAGNYYVDFSGGADSNNGTSINAPWKHCPGDINATSIPLSATPAAGDVIYFKGGVTYSGQINLNWAGSSDASRITYDGNSSGNWGTGKAILDGGGTLSYGFYASTYGKDYITINNFEIRNLLYGGSRGVLIGSGTGTTTGTKVINCYIHDVGHWHNDSLVDGGGIQIQMPRSCTISNNTLVRTGGGGIGISGGQNCTISENDIGAYVNWGISLSGDYEQGSGHIVSHNTIHDNYQYDTDYWTGTGAGPHSDFVFVRGTSYTVTNVIVERNLFYNNVNFGTSNGGTAMIYLSEVQGCTVRNNVFINPHSYYTVESYNPSMPATGVVGHKFYNNTFYTPRVVPLMVRVGRTSNLINGNYDIRNNIFVAPSGGAAVYFNDDYDIAGLTSDNNVYYNATTVGVLHKYSPWTDWTLALWQGLGHDPHGIGVTSVATINFGDTTGYPTACQTMKLGLVSGSPAIGKGVTLSGFTTDINGVPRPNGSWDIGAYQQSTSIGLATPAPAKPTNLRVQ